MNDFSERVANLSAEKRALLEAHLKSEEGIAERAIPHRREFAPAPLAFAQQRMWFMDQLQPGNPAYNRPIHIHVRGALNIAVLENSINEIVRRHEILRTSFLATDGQPVQAVASSLTLSLPVIDLGSLPAHEQQAEVSRIVTEDAQHSFDLSRVPLLKVGLVRLGETEHLLVLTLHYIVFDGWSAGILIRELSTLSKALSAGEQPSLPELPIQFGDFARWQRQRMQGGVLDAELAYWKTKLSGQLPLLELATDRVRPPAQTFRGARQHLSLPANVSASLKSLSQREGATLLMTLLAAFQALLHRYTGGDDIIVGVPIAGRNRLEVENLIGIFINTLALRTDLSGNPSFRQLLGRVRTTALEAHAHQELPFEKLVEELQPVRDLSRTPVFQVLFQLRNLPDESVEANEELRMAEADFDSGSAKLDLALDIGNKPEGLSCVVEYNTDLFDAASIARLLNHYENLLRGILDNPNARLSELPLLAEVEQKQLLLDWNETYADYPQHATVQSLFEAQVEKTPDAIAIVFGDEELTYAELNAKANRLAHHLIFLGVGPDVLIALCVERSIEMIVALLGILKAGGAYLPLDPAYPKERLAFMLEDGEVSVLITQRHLEDRLPQQPASRVYLDDLKSVTAAYPDTDPVLSAIPDNLAYVIYTSGSTGRPKGVAMSHRPLANLLAWQLANTTLGAGERTLQFASLSFDVSFQETFSTWCSGGALVIAPEELRRDAEGLLHFVQEAAISRLFLPFVVLQHVAQAATEVPSSLREVITAGEQLRITPQIANLFSRLNNCTLHNHYGPTESHVVTAFVLSGVPHQWPPLPPIGRPIANARIYLLDDNLNPVPIGVAGELHIGGKVLARGYLNRPELTTQKFIPNPFSEEPNARLYKTGDLARYLPDGNIEFLGRLDHQVKIRGFRIELGEIEAVLANHPDVKACAVIARDTPGDKRLVAYVVVAEESAPADAMLRDYLKQSLPDYMLPSAFVVLDQLPLTPNGKLDRKALPAPKYCSEEFFVAPRTPNEETLAAIWAEVLKLEKIGIHDNFFELGGHSLLATQVISRVRSVFDIELPLRTLFEAPTVAGLSLAIASISGLAESPQIIISRRSTNQPLPLSFAQQRLWFLQQYEKDSVTYNTANIFRLTGPLNVESLRQAFAFVISRHEILRTSFAVVDEEPVQVIHAANEFRLSLIDLTDLPENLWQAEARRLAKAEAGIPFDLSTGPLIRIRLLRLSPNEHALLITQHHIVFDGWSDAILYRDLSASYQAYAEGEAPVLPELPIQYADYSMWQRGYLTGKVLDKEIAYWKDKLQNAPPLLELPTDRPRPATQTHQGAHATRVFDRDLLKGLKALSQRNSATLFMTLLAAFKALLSRYTRAEDIVVGSPIAGRTRTETENLVGFFVNTLVLRTDLSGDPGFTELLTRVRETALSAYAHQDLPFEKLVEELNPERGLSYSPLFQVMFALQNVDAIPLKLAGLSIARIELDMATAKFDLFIALTETEAGLHLSVEYNTDLFDAASIARLINHYENLLRGLLGNPIARLSELPLLIEVEQKQLLLDWNETHADYPQHATVQSLFEAQVESTPDAIALVLEVEELTYAELNAKANRLAHHLIVLGVGPEVLVGICAERSIEMIVALMAILKAGGAYLPLDPAYPKERLVFMLEDARIAVLVTSSKLAEDLPETGAKRVLLDDAQDSRYPETNPKPSADADNLAYVIYTSGSTGTPKGVTIPHRGVIRLVKNTNYADFNSTDIFLQFAPVSFDASTFEIWGALLNGARLVIMPSQRAALEDLADTLIRERVTTLWLTASLFNLMVDKHLDALIQLRQLLAGGDVLSVAHVEKFLAAAPACRLINGYGPTENTTFTCCYSIPHDGNIVASVPIGRPIANTQVYILDPHLNPVPIGIPGELHIGGVGLARGYLNRPELTAEKFVANPFSDQPGARLYKTGDLARYLADGNIEFLGRIDTQVKIRGFRIELGEIEAVLMQHRAVGEAVVIVREDARGDKTLVAYVVNHEDASPSELRSFLKDKLPEYMLPSAIVMLDRLPISPNGKLDRKALPAPEYHSEEAFVAPRTPTEETLAAIWAEVLQLDRIGVNDNFFELGGDSILSIQIVARANRAGLRLTPRHIFQHQTIAELASVAGTAPTIRPLHFSAVKLDRGQLDSLVEKFRRLKRGSHEISAEEIEDVYPLSPTQRVMLLYNLCYPAGSGVYHQEFYYTLRGNLDVSLFERSWQQMVERHSILRTAFLREPVQVVKRHVSLPLDYRDWRGLTSVEQQDQLEEFLKVDRRRRFEISEPPLMRLALFRLSQNHFQFIWISHHVLLDGWSRSVLWKEILGCYEALSRGRQPDWQPAPPFRDYIAWLQQQQREGSEAEAFWRALLKDFTTPIPLGVDAASRSSEQEKLYGKQQIQLSRAETAKLQAFARRHRVTLNTLAQAAWALLLSRRSGESDVLFGGVLSVRPAAIPGVESMVGPLINTLPIRVQLTPRDSVRTFLKKLHEQQVEMSQYDYSSLAKVQEWSGVPRGRALFDSLFLFQNFPQGARRGQGASFEISLDRSAGRTNYALAIVVRPGAELSLAIGFDGDRFDQVAITQMLGDFQALLRAIVADPGRRVADLGPLTARLLLKAQAERGHDSE